MLPVAVIMFAESLVPVAKIEAVLEHVPIRVDNPYMALLYAYALTFFPMGIRLIVEQANVPVLVDAGVGTASDAAEAMELGCDGVLMNTAIAQAKDPVRMARAMKHAVEAGRLAYLSGRMPKKMYADPSSPLAGLI